MNTAHGIRRWSKAAFFLISSAALFISGLYFYNIIKWAEYPDFGYGFRVATGINAIGDLSENGRNSGLEIGDRFLTINGKSFGNLEEFRAAINRKLGSKNIYLLERGGKQIQVVVPNVSIGLKESFFKSGFLFLLGLCILSIGIVIFFMKPYASDSWVFLLFTVANGLFVSFLYSYGKMTPSWLSTAQILFYTFAPATFFHMALSFPQERRLLKLHPMTQCTPYFFSAALFVYIRSGISDISDISKTMLIVILGYLVFSFIFFLASCLQLWLISSSEIVKRRAKMIFLGFAIAVSIPLLDFITSVLFGVYLFPHQNAYIPFIIFFPAFIGYSIVKYDLFEIDAIIKRTYGYVLTTGNLAAIYGLFVLVSHLFFGQYQITQSRIFPLAFILIVVFLFNPVRNRVQSLIDRLFYRLEYDYRETVEKISETMRSLLKLDEIGRGMLQFAMQPMFVDTGSVMLLNRDKKVYETLIAEGEKDEKNHIIGKNFRVPDPPEIPGNGAGASNNLLPADNPLMAKMAEQKKELTIYDIQENPVFESEREACIKTFEELNATLIVPLIYEDRLGGILSLGRKKSGKFYQREDINLLKILANQSTVALENARLLEEVIEKERMEEELAIARDLQTSMLPAFSPKMEGLEIAAISIPAREVGGDFFDFIEMDQQQLGLVVGDVTGKSISGALIMSASRSVFRMLSEGQLPVGEIMNRANARLKKDVKTGMFVALLYAILDAGDKKLKLCSAGQTQPIYLSAETGKPVSMSEFK